MKLIELINLGGPINWVLFALLCFCLCQCIERGIYYFQTRKGSKNYVLTRLQKILATAENQSYEEKKKLLDKEAQVLYYEMNRGLWFLNFISSVAPSIGLLGTVTGLISAFSKMATVETVNIQDLSSGIWEAMLTTAFGMIISIPSLFCYRTFKRIIEKRLLAISLFDENEEKNASHST